MENDHVSTDQNSSPEGSGNEKFPSCIFFATPRGGRKRRKQIHNLIFEFDGHTTNTCSCTLHVVVNFFFSIEMRIFKKCFPEISTNSMHLINNTAEGHM